MKFTLNPGALGHVNRLAEEVRRNVLRDIADDARRFVPVDTGLLRSTIRVEEHAPEVSANTEYAGYVELGTRYMRAQPYLGPALYRKRVLRAGAGS